MLRNIIERLGHIRTVLSITMLSIIVSFIVYIMLMYVLNGTWTRDGILVALITPVIVAPLVSWYLTKFIFQVMALEAKMRSLATNDGLTKLLTRESFLNHIIPLYKLAKRHKSTFAILYMDVDNFKSINDTYGHNTGDKVLKSLGEILKNNKRDSDIVGRIGGEEFAYGLADIELDGTKYFANKIRKIIESTIFESEGIVVNYTMSIGISMYSEHNKVDLDTLINQADKALYLAKASGKNCVKLYSEVLE